jgi:methylated-DNA-[protein]-cysteine S-methyltransferase
MYKKIIKQTPFGPVGLIWEEFKGKPKIVRILLSNPLISAVDQAAKLFPYSQTYSCLAIDHLADEIKMFLKGKKIEFSLDVVHLKFCSDFQELVIRSVCGIPRGSLSTYQLIAEYIGKSNGARAVGKALATNPFPLIIPCHRVIGSGRNLGSYQGGFRMKRALLKNEGIVFINSRQISHEHFHYKRVSSLRQYSDGITRPVCKN